MDLRHIAKTGRNKNPFTVRPPFSKPGSAHVLVLLKLFVERSRDIRNVLVNEIAGFFALGEREQAEKKGRGNKGEVFHGFFWGWFILPWLMSFKFKDSVWFVCNESKLYFMQGEILFYHLLEFILVNDLHSKFFSLL